jgi:hypothetical protein
MEEGSGEAPARDFTIKKDASPRTRSAASGRFTIPPF